MLGLEVRQLGEHPVTTDIRKALDDAGIDDYIFDEFVESLSEQGISLQFRGDGLTEPVVMIPYNEVHDVDKDEEDDFEYEDYDDECDD